jgi:hypothetical protein
MALITVAPKNTAPNPLPVGWDELPVTEGTCNDDIIKINAPLTANKGFISGFSSVIFFIRITPWAIKGIASAYQKTHQYHGKNPSIICIL